MPLRRPFIITELSSPRDEAGAMARLHTAGKHAHTVRQSWAQMKSVFPMRGVPPHFSPLMKPVGLLSIDVAARLHSQRTKPNLLDSR